MPQILTITHIRPNSTILWYDETAQAAQDPDALSIVNESRMAFEENKISLAHHYLSEDDTQRIIELIILDPESVWGTAGYSEENALNKIVYPTMKEYNLQNHISVSVQLTEV